MADEEQIRKLIKQLRKEDAPNGDPYSQYIRKEDEEAEFRKELEKRYPGSRVIENMPYRKGGKSDGPYLKNMPHRKGSGEGGPYIRRM